MARYEITTPAGSVNVRAMGYGDDLEAAVARGLRRIYRTRTAVLGSALIQTRRMDGETAYYEGTACRVGGAILGRVTVYPRA